MTSRPAASARAVSAVRHLASPAARSSAVAVMTSLLVASHVSTSSTEIVLVKRNDAASCPLKAAPAGSVTV
jgi:hypothetical protein